jgi:hypothetical protein
MLVGPDRREHAGDRRMGGRTAINAGEHAPQVRTHQAAREQKKDPTGNVRSGGFTVRTAGDARRRGGSHSPHLSAQVPDSTSTYDDSRERLGALLGAFAAEIDPLCPDLAAVVNAWPGLPEALKAGIVAMVKAAGGRCPGRWLPPRHCARSRRAQGRASVRDVPLGRHWPEPDGQEVRGEAPSEALPRSENLPRFKKVASPLTPQKCRNLPRPCTLDGTHLGLPMSRMLSRRCISRAALAYRPTAFKLYIANVWKQATSWRQTRLAGAPESR